MQNKEETNELCKDEKGEWEGRISAAGLRLELPFIAQEAPLLELHLSVFSKE